MRVAFLSKMDPAVEKIARDVAPAGIDLVFPETETPEALKAAARDAEVFIVRALEVGDDLLSAAPGLRLVHKFGIGVDKIDLAAVRKRGALVAITSGANAAPVAEHAVMLMLAVSRRLIFADHAVRDGDWPRNRLRAECRMLMGRTVGLLGFGNIGRQVARRLQGFGVRLIYHDPRPADSKDEAMLDAVCRPLDQVIADADILSLHLPATPGAEPLMTAARFASMRPGSVLINTARGELIDERALLNALDGGRLAGAGLDVYADEPPACASLLLTHEKVVLTPHSAGSVIDNVANVCAHIFSNIERLRDGFPIPDADLVKLPASGARG